MKSYIVIGLGRFGGSLARQLCTLGAEVLAMDVHNDLVQQLANDVTHAVVGDARDKEVLRALGVRIAMDDFGTGYSSLGLLSQSPADIVKIDRLFIKNIHVESFNRAFIDAVIDLCHSVDIEVTVEGVEERTELDTVRAIGADSVQGFLVSRPLPAGQFEERFLGADATGE